MRSKFMLKYLDVELGNIRDISPVPFDPIVVSDYNLMLQKQRRKEQQLLQERDQELSDKVHSATCEQLVEHVKADWKVCEAHAKDLSSSRSESYVKDRTYSHDRLMKGQAAVEKRMEEQLSFKFMASLDSLPMEYSRMKQVNTKPDSTATNMYPCSYKHGHAMFCCMDVMASASTTGTTAAETTATSGAAAATAAAAAIQQ